MLASSLIPPVEAASRIALDDTIAVPRSHAWAWGWYLDSTGRLARRLAREHGAALPLPDLASLGHALAAHTRSGLAFARKHGPAFAAASLWDQLLRDQAVRIHWEGPRPPNPPSPWSPEVLDRALVLAPELGWPLPTRAQWDDAWWAWTRQAIGPAPLLLRYARPPQADRWLTWINQRRPAPEPAVSAIAEREWRVLHRAAPGELLAVDAEPVIPWMARTWLARYGAPPLQAVIDLWDARPALGDFLAHELIPIAHPMWPPACQRRWVQFWLTRVPEDRIAATLAHWRATPSVGEALKAVLLDRRPGGGSACSHPHVWAEALAAGTSALARRSWVRLWFTGILSADHHAWLDQLVTQFPHEGKQVLWEEAGERGRWPPDLEAAQTMLVALMAAPGAWPQSPVSWAQLAHPSRASVLAAVCAAALESQLPGPDVALPARPRL